MLERLAERDIRRSSGAGDETALIEAALQILYQRKAFREETGMDEEHYPEGKPPPPPPPTRGGPPRGPGPPGRPRTKREMPGTSRPGSPGPHLPLRVVRPGVSQRGSRSGTTPRTLTPWRSSPPPDLPPATPPAPCRAQTPDPAAAGPCDGRVRSRPLRVHGPCSFTWSGCGHRRA